MLLKQRRSQQKPRLGEAGLRVEKGQAKSRGGADKNLQESSSRVIFPSEHHPLRFCDSRRRNPCVQFVAVQERSGLGITHKPRANVGNQLCMHDSILIDYCARILPLLSAATMYKPTGGLSPPLVYLETGPCGRRASQRPRPVLDQDSRRLQSADTRYRGV